MYQKKSNLTLHSHLPKKLSTLFNEQQLNIQANVTKKTVAWKVGSIPSEHAAELFKASTQSDFLSIWRCAKKLRKYILSLEQKPLEEPLTVENIMEAEAEIPKSLKEYYKILYTGNVNVKCCGRKSHSIKESSANSIFTCFGKKIIRGKHLSLGLTAKFLIGRKTMVSLLNGFGHYATDETIRRIDLGLEETIFKTKTLFPSHNTRRKNFSTGLGWDNFDINIKHHLEQIQYTTYTEFVTRTRCSKNKFKLSNKLPLTYKMHQFETMEK